MFFSVKEFDVNWKGTSVSTPCYAIVLSIN